MRILDFLKAIFLLPWLVITTLSDSTPIVSLVFLVILCAISDLSREMKEVFLPKAKAVAGETEPKAEAKWDSVVPVVFVHGLLGFGEGRMGGLSYFGGIEDQYEKVYIPDVGAFTSLYDRARELFYYLKGGQVDYGREHSETFGHSRYGRFYKQGKYPQWDEDHALHFVGHSAGAQTVRVLQQMLADKSFKGYENTSADWILSLTAVCGALNGSTKTYIAGMRPDDWRSVKLVSPLRFCCASSIIYHWLDIPWLRRHFGPGFDHFNMSWRKIGVSGLVDRLLGKSGPLASADWILPDLTIQGSMAINRKLQTFPRTYYFSYAAELTKKVNQGTTINAPSSVLKTPPWFSVQILKMSLWRYPTHVPRPYEEYRDEQWADNDGQLNTVSMTHPRVPTEHTNCLMAEDSESKLQIRPGIWYYKFIEGYHSQFVLNPKQIEFYGCMIERCRKHFIKRSPLPQQHCTEEKSWHVENWKC